MEGSLKLRLTEHLDTAELRFEYVRALLAAIR
jgi:hypothetical protein